MSTNHNHLRHVLVVFIVIENKSLGAERVLVGNSSRPIVLLERSKFILSVTTLSSLFLSLKSKPSKTHLDSWDRRRVPRVQYPPSTQSLLHRHQTGYEHRTNNKNTSSRFHNWIKQFHVQQPQSLLIPSNSIHRRQTDNRLRAENKNKKNGNTLVNIQTTLSRFQNLI